MLEFYPSLRSPYTYIAMERVYALARRYPVELVLRPVLPMVMRGLPVPRTKQLYIALDTKREAEDAGLAFGRVCDPVGRPVERAFSLYPWARERGRAAELLLSFARAAFAEGIDTGSDAGLRFVVERAGLDWDEARERLATDAWRDELEANREALFALGLWGVPSFCSARRRRHRALLAPGARTGCGASSRRSSVCSRERASAPCSAGRCRRGDGCRPCCPAVRPGCPRPRCGFRFRSAR